MPPEQHEKARQALRTVEHLYPSMLVLSRLAVILKDLNASQGDIADLIKTDASLATDIIRISNTAYYGSGSKCSDIQNALLIIGQNRVLKAVSLCISRNVFNQDLRHYGVTASEYWSNSIAAGLLMEAMAGKLGVDSDQAYTLGILHSVGMTIINRILQELHSEMYWDSSIPQTLWEEHLTGFNYAVAGAEVMDKWKFPANFTDVIRHQVQPDQAVEPTPFHHSLHFVVHLLNLMGWKLQMVGILQLDEPSHAFLDAFRLDEDALSSILVQARDQMERVKRLFTH